MGALEGAIVRGARAVRRTTGWLVALLLLGLGGAALLPFVRASDGGSLDLGDPGRLGGRRIAMLGGDAPACRAALERSGVRFVSLDPVRRGEGCGYDDGVRLESGGSATIRFRPAGLGTSCPVAAGLAAWEWASVQPAAREVLGQRVTAIEHFGSYNCRRLYGRDRGNWSEHATANAVDVAGFVLADGRRISVVGDWRGDGPEAAFLHRVRDGACDAFATVLSPDYNAAHRDHLHLDQARRGGSGWRACR